MHGAKEKPVTVNIEHRDRLSSKILKELTDGKFIIPCEELKQLENIGQGIIL